MDQNLEFNAEDWKLAQRAITFYHQILGNYGGKIDEAARLAGRASGPYKPQWLNQSEKLCRDTLSVIQGIQKQSCSYSLIRQMVGQHGFTLIRTAASLYKEEMTARLESQKEAAGGFEDFVKPLEDAVDELTVLLTALKEYPTMPPEHLVRNFWADSRR